MLRLICLIAFAATLHASDWPQWRGPDGQGHADATDLVSTWSETNNVRWKTALPGRGWSSPVIEGDQIWMTAATEVEATPEKTQERMRAGKADKPMNVCERVTFHALCVDKNSGALLHNLELMDEKEPQYIHRLNSYASPTPVIEKGRLYCHFGTFGTVCVDTKTAKVRWQNRNLHVVHENGPGSSPIIVNDHLIFHMDGIDEQFIVALDKNTGDVAWQTKRSGALHTNPQMRKAYATPLLTEIGGQAQLLSPAADWLYSYEPSTGRELWKLNYGALGYSVVPRPLTGHGLAYICTSFDRSELLAIRLESAEHEIAWRYNKGVSQMPCPTLVGNEIYFVTDSAGIVTCLDARTGEERWKERIGGNFSAAPLLADGKLYFFSREGVTTVLKPGPKFQLLAQNTLDGSLMASAAAVDKALFLRTDKALYRIER
jgi:outer membrane protein assembly factor BamB